MMILSCVLALIRGYQRISRWFPPRCRFAPTCSEYARKSLTDHGLMRGSALSIIRILKCHPFHPGGLDPVPPVTPYSHHHDCAKERPQTCLN